MPGVGELFALAEVPVPLLATVLGSAGEQRGLRITVETTDGTLLASLPHDEARMGERLSRSAADMPTDGSAFTMPSRFTDTQVIASARATLYPDVVVVASYDAGAAFAEWAQDQRRVHFAAAGAALLLTALGLALLAALRQREKIESERARARQVLENAIESMSDGFVMFDADDRLVICNTRYRELYAVSSPFITPGALFEDIIREGAKRGQYPQAGADIEAFVKDLTAWHRGDYAPMERLLPDGRWLLVTERRTEDGGTVGIRTDITALKAALTETAAARDAARTATEAKSRFLAHMSHELRTPLNGVLGLAQALAADPALAPAQRERARTLEAAGRHLVAVANDVLDLAKIEAGRFELRPAALALPELLRECVDWVRAAAANKRIALHIDIARDLPPSVVADGTRLRQLVLNFLSNAVKFTPPGGRVEMRATAAAPAGQRVPVRIEVSDDGPGVPEALRTEVFGDFVQLGDRPDGTGLGLAIAAHIAARMDGRIGCDANTAAPGGRGALFWTELPLEPAAGAAPAAPAAAPSEVAANRAAGEPAGRRRAQAEAAGAGRGRRAGQPRGAARAARIGGTQRELRQRRGRSGGGARGLSRPALRRGADGRDDAGAGRARSDQAHPRPAGRRRARAGAGRDRRAPFPRTSRHATPPAWTRTSPSRSSATRCSRRSHPVTAPRTETAPAGSAPGASPGAAEAGASRPCPSSHAAFRR